MKKISISGIFFLIMSNFLMGQSAYFSDGFQWQEVQYGVFGPSMATLTLCGDTLIHDTLYQKVNMYFDTSAEPNLVSTSLIRQEGQKIWRRRNAGELLLYDFSVEAGDTVTVSNFWANWDIDLVVEDTYPVNLNGFETKAIEFEHTGDETEVWYEGIGSNRGFLSAGFSEVLIADLDIWLCCVSTGSNSIPISVNEACDCQFQPTTACALVNAVRQNEFSPKVRLYPNPVGDYAVVEFEKSYSNIECTLMNAVGQRLSTRTYDNVRKIRLDLKGDPGVYFVKLRGNEDAGTVVKIIKY